MAVFRKDERLEFDCEFGYKSEGRTPECTEEGWNPKPFCKEIECYYQNVVNGEMLPKRDKYRQDDTVDLNCHRGFVAPYSKDRKTTCTIDGWVPPLKCENKACEYPEIENGRVSSWNYRYYRNHYFPVTKGRGIDYECDRGYATEPGYGSGRITCTEEGWTPAPRCRRACERLYFDNMDMFFNKQHYTEGQTVSFRCYPGFFTHEGQEAGTVECLSNGHFSQATCIRMCKLTLTGAIKSYKPKKLFFDVKDTVQYECNDGYHSYQSNIVDTSECTTEGWLYIPQCKEITCSLNVGSSGRTRSFKNGDVAKLKCKEGLRLDGAEKVQCYYFGWYPKLPSCRDTNEDGHPAYFIGDDAEPDVGREIKCLEPPKLPNAEEQTTQSKYEHGETVVYSCKINYILYGSNTISCENGRWKSPPQCIERRSCSKPPTIISGKCLMPTNKNYFYSDDTVTYLCDPGYRITGLNESTCIGGRWTSTPTCSESPCNTPSIDYGSVIELRAHYISGATVNFICESGYKLISGRQTQCLKGEWHFLPKCISTSCGAAPVIKDGEYVDKPRQSYKAGERVTYRCKQGFVLKKQSYVTCEDSQWTEPSVCLKEGSECGPVPFVHNGDITDFPQPSYRSGSTVEYKCQIYHKIRGNNKVNCMHGAWSAPPECLEPCTTDPEGMAENNIRHRWSDEVKLYVEHDQTIEFTCLSNDNIQHEDSPPFRVRCNRGKLLYPRCIKRGSCAPSSKEMDPKNIILMNENKEIKDGSMVEFTCKPGFYKKPNQVMRVKCLNGKLDYPECDSTPPVCSRPPLVPHGKVVGDVKNEYDLNSSIEYICDEGYVFKGTRMLTCTDWEWSDVPQCIRLCQVTEDKLKEHFVELSLKQKDKMAFFEGEEITFTCISGFRVLAPPGILVSNCSKAGFNYPTCFNPNPCRVSQEGTDLHNLELVGHKVIFHNGDIIQFKCRPEYFEIVSLAGTCKNSNIIYPTCLARGSCILEQKELDQKNIKLRPGFTNLQHATNGQIIEFSCNEGYEKHTRSSDLSQVCEEGFIAYPICIRART